jgi:F0F1-type ATP synthase assembly protein I
MKTESHFKIDEEGNIVKHRIGERFSSKKQIDLTAINIGYYLVTPLLIGVFLGYLIDRQFEWRPYAMLLGIMMGLVGTIYNLVRIIKENARN